MLDAETSGGGFPGWVGAISGSLRTDNAAYEQGAAFLAILATLQRVYTFTQRTLPT